MKPEGIKRKDHGCCPGHDKFPSGTYNNRQSRKAKRRTDMLAHRRARAWKKRETFNELKYENDNIF